MLKAQKSPNRNCRLDAANLRIAFSVNKVFLSLADLNQNGLTVTEVEEVNAIGKHFGIRFREMTGSMRDLAHTVSDSGMILVRPKPDSNGERAEILSKVCWLELEGVASITDQQAESLSKVQYLYIPTSCLELINECTVP